MRWGLGRIGVGIALLLCSGLALGSAQEAPEEAEAGNWLEVHVTAVAAGSLYLDAGREQLLGRGDRVRLYTAAGPTLEAIVRDVSRTSARAELDSTSDGVTIEIGTRGEVLIPQERSQEAQEEAEVEQTPAQEEVPPTPAVKVPEHPPWTQGPEDWNEELPLLAPVQAMKPEDRPTRWRGRTWIGGEWIEDRSGTDREYESQRAGLDLEVTNPFAGAGRFVLDAEWYRRSSEESGGYEDDDSRLRFDRLSYASGGLRGHPQRWEVGRFLSSEFPELGIIDGVEYVERGPSGHRWGASLGMLPDWDDTMSTGDDLESSLFYRWVDGDEEHLAFGAAAQKTWHKGDRDRDLMILTADWRPNTMTSLHSSAWIDYYGSGDRFEDDGFDLTRMVLSATHRLSAGSGLGLFFTHFRYPELLSNELDPVVAASLAKLEVTRVSLNGWTNLTKRLRLSARANHWDDQESSGNGGEVRLAARDMLWRRGEVAVAVSESGGRFSSGLGVRLIASKQLSSSWLRLEYDTTDWEQEDFTGEQQNLRHDALRASWDTSLGADLDLSLWAEQRFGDEQDSTALGFLLQRRF